VAAGPDGGVPLPVEGLQDLDALVDQLAPALERAIHLHERPVGAPRPPTAGRFRVFGGAAPGRSPRATRLFASSRAGTWPGLSSNVRARTVTIPSRSPQRLDDDAHRHVGVADLREVPLPVPERGDGPDSREGECERLDSVLDPGEPERPDAEPALQPGWVHVGRQGRIRSAHG
jgi:hypothetical protein